MKCRLLWSGVEVGIGMNPPVNVKIGTRVNFERIIVKDGEVPGRDLLFLKDTLNLRHDVASYRGKSDICSGKIIVSGVPVLRLSNGRGRNSRWGPWGFLGDQPPRLCIVARSKYWSGRNRLALP